MLVVMMLLLVEREEMKRRVEQKREFSLLEINIIDGIPKTNDLNFGIFTIQLLKKVKVFVFFLLVTGQS